MLPPNSTPNSSLTPPQLLLNSSSTHPQLILYSSQLLNTSQVNSSRSYKESYVWLSYLIYLKQSSDKGQ